MRHIRRWVAGLLLVVAMLLVACGGSGNETPAAATATTAPPAASEATEPDTEEATATAVIDIDETQVPTEVPTEVPTQEAMATSESGSDDGGIESRSPQEIESITSFRVRMTVSTEGEAFASSEDAPSGSISIEGSFTKEPVAQQLEMTFDVDSDEMAALGNSIGYIQMGDQAYTRLGEEWIAVPADESAPDINEFLFIRPSDIVDNLDKMERVGEETLNGREALHLRADRDTLVEIDENNSSGMDLEKVEEAQMDIWVDAEENFVVKMELVAEGKGLNDADPDLEGRLELLVEYYDINEEFEIELPEGVDEAATLPDLEGLMGTATLATLLGNLELPEGADISMQGETAQITVPLSLDDAQTFIEETMADQGFTMDESSSVEAGTYTFVLDDTALNVTLAETGDSTTITITPAP